MDYFLKQVILKKSKYVYDPLGVVFSAMYSYIVSFAGGKMASASGKGNDGGVSMDQLKAVEHELQRKRFIEENERRMEVIRQKSVALQEAMEATKPPKKKKKKVCSFHQAHSVSPSGSKTNLFI